VRLKRGRDAFQHTQNQTADDRSAV
jgi:hypothetical protein